MLLLSLEFSSPRRSVALVRRPDPGAAPEILGAASEEGLRGATALSLVQTALERASVTAEKVQAIVVGLGPGSYTGIRSSIALAQGWQLAREVPAAGVSTVECLALQAQSKGWFGHVTIVIDAQRNEFYLANYEITLTARQIITPLRLAGSEELRSLASRAGELLVGPEISKWCDRGKILFPDAASLVPLAALGSEGGGAENLQPIYLRQAAFVKAAPPRAPKGEAS